MRRNFKNEVSRSLYEMINILSERYTKLHIKNNKSSSSDISAVCRWTCIQALLLQYSKCLFKVEMIPYD